MSATKSSQKTDIRVVIDTNIFVRALACLEPESTFYTSPIRICWKLVISEHIAEEYRRVINEYGYPADAVIHEINKLCSINKYRPSDADPNTVSDNLAPRKDRHIVAPCLEGKANLIVTHDGGIHEKEKRIAAVTGAEVLHLNEAQARLHALQFGTSP